jgi:hypothetical protein
MIVTAQRPTTPVAGSDTTVRAGVALEIRLITSVTYRKGDVRTGIALGDLTASIEGDSLVSWVRATREGNAAYLGTARFELLSSDRVVVREWEVPIAVYYPMNRRFSFPLEALADGDYMLRLTLEARRPDLLDTDVLSAPTVLDSVEVQVP